MCRIVTHNESNVHKYDGLPLHQLTKSELPADMNKLFCKTCLSPEFVNSVDNSACVFSFREKKIFKQ
jgi:hypothetical protein